MFVLHEDDSNTLVGRVGLYLKCLGKIQKGGHRRRDQCPLKSLKGPFLLFSPDKHNVLQQFHERSTNDSKIAYKLVIVAHQT